MKALFIFIFLLALLFYVLHRVGVQPRHDAIGDKALYLEHLARSAELAVNPPPGSESEAALVLKVKQAFTPFEAERAAVLFPEAYAESFFFRDAFHTFTDRRTLTDYMVRTAKASPGVTFEFEPPGRNGIDFYLPWIMILPARDGVAPQRSMGLSRLRFDANGQVIFHQDYWDSADVLVRRVPVTNGLIELVRRRF